jgi:hypothetical protein
MVHLFEDTNLCAIHAKRVTISEQAVAACGWRCCSPCCSCLQLALLLAVLQLHLLRLAHPVQLPAAQAQGRCTASRRSQLGSCADGSACPAARPCPAVAKDLQLARRIRGPVYGVSSY